uniref:Uncharacterized protein n=1 Tax=Arion vulgaris TaxID=1028688 RepID=A0A0B7AMA9_9EUPU
MSTCCIDINIHQHVSLECRNNLQPKLNSSVILIDGNKITELLSFGCRLFLHSSETC